jgi:hypothetical protein
VLALRGRQLNACGGIAVDNPHVSGEFIAAQRDHLTARQFATEYEGTFAEASERVFSWDAVIACANGEETDARPGVRYAVGWDPAARKDRSAVVVIEGSAKPWRVVNRETREVKSTKTGTTRRIPIEAELRPLLSRLHAESKQAKGKKAKRLLWMPDHEDRAVLLRQHLETAGVTRAELFTSDAHRNHITFHDLRATGITWCAVRGDDPLRIKQRAGHKSFSTTEIYIREAENLREGFGAPFPALPASLSSVSASVSAFRRRSPRGAANFPWNLVEQRGIEPRTSALRTQRSPS